MSTFKRCISLLLVMLILVGVFAPAAQAAPAEEMATVDTEAMTIKGTNGFGNLLSQEITESQEEAEAAGAEYPGGYTVTDLVIEGTTATVTYDTMEEATLVVALYTEDGMQMLTSTTATVAPDATEAKLTFEGEMPEYFLASAYLLDSYDLSPLCAAYDTPMYTREMQELLASTVNDYDPEKVLNLDEDETTNFAVYADSTIVIEAEEGINTVASIDDENSTYVIKNANEQITSLVEGNVFVYPYAEGEILIVKVASIAVSGTTATITGTDLELEEVFSQMKIEGDGANEDMIVDDTTAAEGITYVGLVEEGVQPQAWEGGGGATASHEFDIELKNELESDYIDVAVTVTGSLNFSIRVSLNYYVSLSRQFVEFRADPMVKLGVTIQGNITGKYPIGDFGISPVAGVYIGFSPEIQLKYNGETTLSAELSMTIGVAYSNDKGVDNLCTKPKVKIGLSVEGKLFFGLDFVPNARIISKDVAALTLTAAVGFELTASMSGTDYEFYESNAESIHNCRSCLGLDVDFKAELGGTLKFLNCEWLTIDITPLKLTFDLGQWHKSSEASSFKTGVCTNMSYRVTVQVRDEMNKPLKNAAITMGSLSDSTNSKGNVVFYFPNGDYTITVTNGELTKSKAIRVNESKKVTIGLGEDADHILENADDILVAEIVDMDGVLRTPLATYEGHTYTLFDGAASTWDEAKAYCEALGGHLATIANADENTFLYEYMRSSGYYDAYWGLTDREVEGVWEWCTGEPVTYLNWASGEPNDDFNSAEDYGMYWGDKPNGFWNDGRFGDDGCAFLCEWDFILTDIPEQPDAANTIVPNALYPGDYGTEVTDTYILKTAAFRDLVPNEQYVLLAMASIEVEDPLASDNLLFIDQAAAAEDGTLTFRYVQRTPCDISYVVACGASHKNLNDAEISFPKMVADGELQVVDPVVVYDGETLIEGRDYVIVGKVDFTEAGEYICYIRGIHNYTGLVECSYTIGQRENPFTDVTSGSFYYEPVLWAVENGITSGTSADSFSPNDQCMRAHVVTFLWRAVGCPEPTLTVNPFVDVMPSDFYYKPVLWALENGITAGVDATHFGPTVYCNRAQVVTFLYRTKGSPELEAVKNPFTDVEAGSFYESAVLWAVENGITSGLSATSFGPNAICNRAQIVTFLYRAFVND